MKTALTALAVCFAVALTASAFQTPPTQQGTTQDPKPAPQDVTLQGCLIQGSSPAVFLFDNAKVDRKDKSEKGLKYLVLIAGENLDLRQHLNHEVEMVGRIEAKPPLPAGQKVTEKDLPTFATKSVMIVSDTCGQFK